MSSLDSGHRFEVPPFVPERRDNVLGVETSTVEKDSELEAGSMDTANDWTTVAARFGALADLGWVPVPVVALRFHQKMGLAHGDVLFAIALLGSYRDRDEWPSLPQEHLAREGHPAWLQPLAPSQAPYGIPE